MVKTFNYNAHFMKGYNALHTNILHKRSGGTSIYINDNSNLNRLKVYVKQYLKNVL